jgi:anti-sigma regulatory factor (Ser/Thr protein kinase)
MTLTHEQVESRGDFRHGVHFYASEPEFAEVVGAFLVEGLEREEAALVVATPVHRASIARHLSEAGIDLEEAGRARLLVMLDARETLRRVSVGQAPDPARFATAMEDLLRPSDRVRIFGEMVALLCGAGRVDHAMQLEEMWCQWLERSAARLLCAYPCTEIGEVLAHRVRSLHDRSSGPIPTIHPARRRPSAPHAARTFPSDISAIGLARRFVADTVRTFGADDGRADDLALVVTELAANAVLHARTTFVVEVAVLDDGIQLSVRDLGSVVPTMAEVDCFGGSGRGLRIVAAVATRWGIERHRDAKVVWAEFTSGSPA